MNRTAQLENSSVILEMVHHKGQCRGQKCTIHNRSNHHMRSWIQHWRGDIGIMERICEHGIGHPDPDDINEDTIHGCDGCCITPNNHYLNKVYEILDEWSVMNTHNLEDVYEAMEELKRREGNEI